MMFNKRDQYGWMALVLHWLLFLLVAGLLAGGKYSASLPSGEKIGFVIDAHKQIGVAAFVLMAFRLLWRLINTSVPSGEGLLLRLLAFCMHWLLYLLVLAQAAVGVAMSQMSGRAVHFLGVFELPSIAGPGNHLMQLAAGFVPFFSDNVEAAKQMRDLHSVVGDALIALIILHIAVALVHHFVFGTDVLRRMSFGYKPTYASQAYIKKAGGRR